MSDRDPSFAEQPSQEEVSRGSTSLYRSLRYWIGLMLTLAGDVLVIAALFSPWIEVYKTDPTYLIPRQGYSPGRCFSAGRLIPWGLRRECSFS